MKNKPCHNRLWDSPYHNLVENYIYVAKLYRAVLERHLNKTGVYRSQQQFLMYVAQHPNASQREIADYYHLSAATVAVTLKKLEKGGYIRRMVHQEDNRYYRLSITDRGREMVEAGKEWIKAAEQNLFHGFDEAEREQLGIFLHRMQDNLQEQLDKMESEGET